MIDLVLEIIDELEQENIIKAVCKDIKFDRGFETALVFIREAVLALKGGEQG